MAMERVRLAAGKAEGRKSEERKAMLRPDRFVQSADAVQKFVKDNQRLLALSLGVVIVVSGLITFASARKQSADGRASFELAQAQKAFQKAEGPERTGDSDPGAKKENKVRSENEAAVTTASEKFSSLLATHGATSSGRIAELYLGALAAAQGENEKAEKHYRDFLASPGAARELERGARLALAATLVDAGKNDEALKEYRTLFPKVPRAQAVDKGKDKPGDPNSVDRSLLGADEALFFAAKLEAKAGRNDEARQLFERVQNEYPTSTRSSEVTTQLESLPPSVVPPAAASNPAKAAN